MGRVPTCRGCPVSVLPDALKHPQNRPGPLVRWLASQVAPSADLSGLTDAGGVVCDFRPGLEEKDPSLSVSVGKGGAVFRRHGGDDAGLSAVQYTAQVLGVSKKEAAQLLIDRAGLVDEKPAGPKIGRQKGKKPPRGPRPAQDSPAKEEGASLPTPKPVGLSEALEKLAKFGPLAPDDLAYRLKGLRLIEDPEDTSEAAQEVTRRGLWPAVRSGLLRPYALEEGAALPAHSFAGALFFEVRGPDGAVWAVKFRNTDTGLDIAEANTGKRPPRYAYTGKGAGRPAWCAGPMRSDLPTLLIEGELNGAAVAVMLEAAGLGDAYNVQGLASAGALPHVSHLTEGARVYVFADMGDKRGEGEKARVMWGTIAHALGAQVFQIGQEVTGDGTEASPRRKVEANPFQTPEKGLGSDACDALASAVYGPTVGPLLWGRRLEKAIEAAQPWKPAPPVEAGPPGSGEEEGQGAGVLWVSDSEGFALEGGKLCAVKKRWVEGEEVEDFDELLNFSALITAEITQEDGTGEAPKLFEIAGRWPDGRPMNPARLTIPAPEFAGMGWASGKWGASAIVRSGNGKKDKAREGIQRLSAARGIDQRTVYQFTGWIDTEDGPVYLTAGASIGARGGVEGVEVDLSPEGRSPRLTGYALPDPAKAEAADVRDAVRASLALLDLVGLDPVSVPVMGAMYRAPLGRADFVVWLTGETGRNKTALLSLAQAHYGAAWNAEHLPEGWGSSANGLEKAAHTVKDALFLIDDFKPAGSATDINRIHGAAARIMSGAADGVGRGTMTADRKARAGLFPRGLVITSGETLPRGHSNRARAVIVDVTRKLIPDGDAAKSEGFYDAADRAKDGVYALALACYIQGIAGNLEALRVGSEAHTAHVRQWAKVFKGAHGRTGRALAELSYGWACFLAFAVSLEALTEGEAVTLWGRVVEALAYTSEGQAEHLHSEDPNTRALSLTASLLAQGRIYLPDLKSGEAPADSDTAQMCGYQKRVIYAKSGEGADVEDLTTRPGAVKVGYYQKSGGDEWAYFDPEALHEQLQRAAQGQAGAALPDKATLWANMRDRLHPLGLMRCQVEGQRVRPYWKVTTPDSQRRQLLALSFPLDNPAYEIVGTLGTVGTDGEEKTYDTGFLPVPITLFFKKVLGTLGTEAPGFSFSPSSAAVTPALSADLEGLEDWGEV